MLRHDQEVSIRTVEGLMRVHTFPCGINVHTHTGLHGRVAGARYEVQSMDPVYRLVKIERVPSQLVRDLMDTISRSGFGVCVECCMLSRLEGLVIRGWQNPIEP